jgi:serine/threonine-protein kinase
VLCSSPLPYGKVEKGTVVTLTVSSGVGDKHKVDLVIDLPAGVTDTLNMTVTIDGVLDSEQSQQVVPAVTGSVTVSVEGHGTSSVVVMLNDQTYREYTIDFTTGKISNIVTHDFIVPTTAPEAPTQPLTVSPYVEPTTQYVDPYATTPIYDPNTYNSVYAGY